MSVTAPSFDVVKPEALRVLTVKPGKGRMIQMINEGILEYSTYLRHCVRCDSGAECVVCGALR